MTTEVEYIETCGREFLRELNTNADLLRQEANTLIALLLAGVGAALTFAAQSIDGKHVEFVASIVTCIYLAIVAFVLAIGQFGMAPFPSVNNEPKILRRVPGGIERIRILETDRIQRDIDCAIDINRSRAKLLNGCRVAAALTPLVGVLAWYFAR